MTSIPGLDVPWWKTEPPLRVWQHEGVYCALGAGYAAVNGYVLLPDGHPWRELDLCGEDWERGPEVHGGITFGPDDTGWIGFDTAHAWDYWTEEELCRAGLDGADLARAVQFQDQLYHYAPPDDPDNRHWTAKQLIAEVEHLARQVRAAIE